MNKYLKVAEIVTKLYKETKIERSKWLWKHHIKYVAEYAELLAQKYNGNLDYSVAGAYLHDIGDVISLRDSTHETRSLKMAGEILNQAGYTKDEILEILNEVLIPHSCRSGNLPKGIDGKILATADALAHFSTDFYTYFCWMHIPDGKTYSEFKEWVNEKLDRDFNVKIFFDEEKILSMEIYTALKKVFLM